MKSTPRRGFTIVELLIVITIMAILLTLSVVNMAQQQVNARDSERKTDTENIARGLERYYNELGNVYPDLTVAATAVTANSLPGVDHNTYYFSFSSTNPSFTVATGLTGAVDDSSASGQATLNTIVYLPMTWSVANSQWEACDLGEECTRYALYYMSEVSNTTATIRSSQQQ